MEKDELIEIHPGRVILEEFLAPRGISVWHLAKELGLPARQVYEIVQGQHSITTDIARRLAHYFGLSERFWLRLQAAYDLEVRKARLAPSDRTGTLEHIGSGRLQHGELSPAKGFGGL